MMTNLDEYDNQNSKSTQQLMKELSQWETKINDWLVSHPHELTIEEKVELSKLRTEGLKLGLAVHRAIKKI